MPSNSKEYLSSAAPTTKREEYVVGGAQLSCDGSTDSSARITLNASPNTRFEVLNGMAATNMDTSIKSNVIGNFGTCKKQSDAPCDLNPVPKWFNASKNVGVTTETLVKKLSLERDSAIQAIKTEAKMSDDDWAEYLDRIHMMCTSGCIRNGKIKIGINETDIKVYKNIVSSLEEMKTNPEKNVYKISPESLDFTITLMSKVVSTIEELYSRLEQGQNAEQENVKHLLTTNSVLVCRNGPGTISIVDNGQKAAMAELAKIIRIRETIHVIVQPRDEENFVLTRALQPLDECYAVNKTVKKAIDEKGATEKDADAAEGKDYIIVDNTVIGTEDQKSDAKKIADEKNQYDFTGDVAEMFLGFVFEGDTVRTIGTEFQKKYSTRQTVDTDGCGKSVQDNQDEKEIQLRSQIISARKLGYMLFYGENAVAQYNDDARIFFTALERGMGSSGTNWRAMFQHCNYGLWGKYYDEIAGWHRGIDISRGIGSSVYAIEDGTVIEIGECYRGDIQMTVEYYISVESAAGYTIIYMHLETDKTKDSNGIRVIKKDSTITAGQLLGTENKNTSILPMEPHTHVEFDPGQYTYQSDIWKQCHGISRPWADRMSVKLDDFIPGQTFSCNPYPIIERIWSERG